MICFRWTDAGWAQVPESDILGRLNVINGYAEALIDSLRFDEPEDLLLQNIITGQWIERVYQRAVEEAA